MGVLHVVKYMGSKRLLLQNGLGDLVRREASTAGRFVDLFAGTGAVACHVAERVEVPVLAVDLQEYATALSAAVITRTLPLDLQTIESDWLGPARRYARRYPVPPELASPERLTVKHVKEVRHRVEAEPRKGTILRAYGGHYFSPEQATVFDALLRRLPEDPAERAVCTAAVVRAAMRCAAAPGHTAQPFQPTSRSLPHIVSAWCRDPFAIVEEVVAETVGRHALVRGEAKVGDASYVLTSLTADDVVFVDPPYSSAQYSRYYHVLETVARGGCGPVEGAGRYPPPSERPSSDFSRKSTAASAVMALMSGLAERGCRTILTFPQYEASNGVDGREIVELCRRQFEVDVRTVNTRFSTLGGNNTIRASRRRSAELLVFLKPRRRPQ